MKKQLITLATATAMTAPAAVLADAHSDGPEVYGRVHLSLDHEGYDVNDDGDSGDLAIASRASRLGVRGTHDLDVAGLEAFYQFEQQVDWGTPEGIRAQARDTFVGVRGDWGQVRAGRLPALNSIVYGPGNYFPTQAGDVGNILWAMGSNTDGNSGYTGYGGTVAGDDVDGSAIGGRTPKPALEYSTALPGPVQASVMLVPSTYDDAAEGYEHDLAAFVTFDDGPISAQASVINYNFEGGDDAENGIVEGEAHDDTLIAFSGEYDLDMMRFGAGYATVSADQDDRDDDAFWLGGAFDVTATGTINAQYSMLLGDDDDSDASIFALGYTEALSDRTSAYANVAFIDNDEKTAVNPHGYAATAPQDGVAPDEDGQVVSVGILHDF